MPPASQPICYVFVLWTDQEGAEHIQRYVTPHDGVRQAADQAIRALWGVEREYLQPSCRIREVLVFENVEPRRLYFERVTRPDFELREIG